MQATGWPSRKIMLVAPVARSANGFYDRCSFEHGQLVFTSQNRPSSINLTASRRNGHDLLLRLTPRKGDTLRFLYDPSVPFTNNQAERLPTSLEVGTHTIDVHVIDEYDRDRHDRVVLEVTG